MTLLDRAMQRVSDPSIAQLEKQRAVDVVTRDARLRALSTAQRSVDTAVSHMGQALNATAGWMGRSDSTTRAALRQLAAEQRAAQSRDSVMAVSWAGGNATLGVLVSTVAEDSTGALGAK